MRRILRNSLLAGALSIGLLGSTAAIAQVPGSAGGGAGQQPSTSPRPNDMPGTNPNGPMGPGNGTNTAPAKVDDKKFAKEAAMGGLLEVELGKLAAQKGSSDAVKQFGQKMVDDHTKANDELKQAASQSNIELPSTLDKKHQQMVDKMSSLSGPAFDKAYMKDMVKDHQKDVKEFENESQGGTDPNIKSFATKTLPILQSHLDSAKQINKQAS